VKSTTFGNISLDEGMGNMVKYYTISEGGTNAGNGSQARGESFLYFSFYLDMEH
jgi:hypothetical protein